MALYKVIDKEAAEGAKPRLVKARTLAEALRHVTESRFEAQTVTKVEDAAAIMAEGVPLEIAGQVVEAAGDEEGKAKAAA